MAADRHTPASSCIVRARLRALVRACVIALALACSAPATASAADFVQVGATVNVSSNSAGESAIAFDGATPYVAYRETVSAVKTLYVRTWSSPNWNLVGGAINVGDLRGGIDMIVPTAASPYVVYGDWDGNKNRIYVRRWSAGSWQLVGPDHINYSGGNVQALDPSITWDGANPIVAWREDHPNNTEYQIRVRRFDGANWVLLGDALNVGIQSGLSPKVVMRGTTPYVFWTEVNDQGVSQLYTRSWNGTEWSGALSLNLDPQQNATAPDVQVVGTDIYVTFTEIDSASRAAVRVRRLGAGGWSTMGGSLNLSATTPASSPTIGAVGTTPWVAFSEGSRVYVRSWTGAYWKSMTRYVNNVGSASASQPTLAGDGSAPWISWSESADVYVKRWDVAAIPPTTDSGTLVPGADRAGGNGDFRRDVYSSSCGYAATPLWSAMSEDADSATHGTCSATTSVKRSAQFIEGTTNAPSSVALFDLTDSPANTTIVSAINVRMWAAKTGARTATAQVQVHLSDGTPVGTPTTHSLASATFTQFSYPINSLSLTKAQVDGMYVTLTGAVSGSGSGSEVQVSTINLDITYDTSCPSSSCPPTTPENVSPLAWTNDSTPTLVSTDFDDNEGDAQSHAQWQVRVDGSASDYSTTFVDSGQSTTDLTQYTPATPMTDGTAYWFHVRHRDADGEWSAYSNETKVTYDGTPPAGGYITYPTGLVSGVTLTFDAGTDAVSGIDALGASVERRSAPYAGTCGAFGSWNQVGSFGLVSPHQDIVAASTCYEYRYIVRDNAGNSRTYSTGAIAIVGADTTPPTVPQLRRLYDRTTSSVAMQWAPASDNQTPSSLLTYDVQTSPTGAVWTNRCMNVAVRTCDFPALTEAVPAYFQVRARDASGNVSAWGRYADVTSDELYPTATPSPLWSNGTVFQALSPVVAPHTTTVTQNMVSLTSAQLFLPFGTSVTASPLTTVPASTGKGWLLQDGIGNGVDSAGINDGPVSIDVTHYASKITGEAHLRPRLWQVSSTGTATNVGTVLYEYTGASNAYASLTPQTDTGRWAGPVLPVSFVPNESYFVEDFLMVTTAAGSSGGAMVIRLNQQVVTAAPPGTEPDLPTALSPATGGAGGIPTLGATYEHPAGVAGHLVFEVREDLNGSPGDVIDTGYSSFELADNAGGSYVPNNLPGEGTYHWTVKGEDRFGRVSAVSEVRTFTYLLAPVNGSLPAITGTTNPGQVLTASTGGWSGSPSGYTYQWRRCDAAGASCADIAGATASTYTLVAGDLGSTIRVVVTATNAYGSANATSTQTAVITNPGGAPANTALPVVSGTELVGSTLSTTNGTWTGSPSSWAYQWRRCDAAGASCVDIAGATASTYALVGADAGSTIRVVVTATNGFGSTPATSTQTGVIAHALTITVTGYDTGGGGPHTAPATSDLGAVAVLADTRANTTVTVATTSPGGYTLSARDPDVDTDALHKAAAPVGSIPWMAAGSVATPAAFSGGGMAISAWGGLATPARWCVGGQVNCTSLADSDLLWAGLTTTSQQVTSRTSAVPGGDTTNVPIRLDAPTSTPVGAYTGTIAFTAVAVP